MDTITSQLKKDFYAQLRSMQPKSNGITTSSVSLLTEEELSELATVWIQLSVWKKKQSAQMSY